MIIVSNGITQVPVHLALQDISFKEVTVSKETHFVKQVTQMELVSLATVATFWIMVAACPSQNLLTSLCTILFAAPRDLHL